MSKLFETRRQTKYKPMFTIINFGSRVWVLDNFLMWTLCEGGLNMCNVQSVKCDRRIMTAEAAGATKKLPKICSRAWNCDPYFLPISLTRISFKVTFISFMSRATGRGSCCVACASSSRIVTLGIEDIRFFLSSLRFDDSWRATMAPTKIPICVQRTRRIKWRPGLGTPDHVKTSACQHMLTPLWMCPKACPPNFEQHLFLCIQPLKHTHGCSRISPFIQVSCWNFQR